MDRYPLVTVIIPCYQAVGFLERSVQSVFDQTYPNLELLLIDDASSDGTLDLIEKLKQDAPIPIRSYPLSTNRGAPYARNIGLQEAEGSYVQFLDADDELMSGKIDRQIALAQGENSDLVVGNFRLRYQDGREVPFHWERDPWIGLLKTRLGNTTANLWKKELLDNIGRWSEGLKSSQEYELLFRVLKADARIAFDQDELAFIHRRTHGSISSMRPDTDKWKDYVDLRIEVLKYLEEKRDEGLQPYYQAVLHALQNLSAIDRELAKSYYNRYFPRDFHPDKDLMNPAWYRFLFGLLGFGGAERIRNMLQRIHPRNFLSLPEL